MTCAHLFDKDDKVRYPKYFNVTKKENDELVAWCEAHNITFAEMCIAAVSSYTGIKFRERVSNNQHVDRGTKQADAYKELNMRSIHR